MSDSHSREGTQDLIDSLRSSKVKANPIYERCQVDASNLQAAIEGVKKYLKEARRLQR